MYILQTHTHTRILPRSSSPRSVCSGRRFSATGISTVPARHLTEWPWQSRRRMPSPAKRTRRRDSIVRGAVVETISIFSSIPSTTNQDGLIGNVAQRSGQVLMSPNYTARDDPVIDAGTIQRFGVVLFFLFSPSRNECTHCLQILELDFTRWKIALTQRRTT